MHWQTALDSGSPIVVLTPPGMSLEEMANRVDNDMAVYLRNGNVKGMTDDLHEYKKSKYVLTAEAAVLQGRIVCYIFHKTGFLPHLVYNTGDKFAHVEANKVDKCRPNHGVAEWIRLAVMYPIVVETFYEQWDEVERMSAGLPSGCTKVEEWLDCLNEGRHDSRDKRFIMLMRFTLSAQPGYYQRMLQMYYDMQASDIEPMMRY